MSFANNFISPSWFKKHCATDCTMGVPFQVAEQVIGSDLTTVE